MSIYNQYFGDAGPEQSLILFQIVEVSVPRCFVMFQHTFKNLFSGATRQLINKLGIHHWELEVHKMMILGY